MFRCIYLAYAIHEITYFGISSENHVSIMFDEKGSHFFFAAYHSIEEGALLFLIEVAYLI